MAIVGCLVKLPIVPCLVVPWEVVPGLEWTETLFTGVLKDGQVYVQPVRVLRTATREEYLAAGEPLSPDHQFFYEVESD